jgi:hypothetical protein
MPNFSRYLAIRAKLNKLSAKHQLTFKDEELLDFVAVAALKDQKLKVGDLIHVSELGSQASVHGRLSDLIERGFLHKEIAGGDSRAKFISLGSKGKTRAKEISRILETI